MCVCEREREREREKEREKEREIVSIRDDVMYPTHVYGECRHSVLSRKAVVQQK